MKKNNLSIGIVAYNEEANIRHLLHDLMLQMKTSNIKEIIIISDGSSDRTVDEVELFSNKYINLINHKERKGKAVRENELLRVFKGDYLLLIDADVLPDKKFMHNVNKSLQKNKDFGIIGGKVKPQAADSFFEKVINFSVEMKQDIYEKLDNKNNIYLCHGRIRILSRKFAKKLTWRKGVSEDAYSYLLCVKKNFKFIFDPKILVYYKSPQNLNDHIKQSARFFQGRKELEKIFGTEYLAKQYLLPKNVLFISMISFLIKNPILFLSYLLILLFSNYKSRTGSIQQASWDPSDSSKKLSAVL